MREARTRTAWLSTGCTYVNRRWISDWKKPLENPLSAVSPWSSWGKQIWRCYHWSCDGSTSLLPYRTRKSILLLPTNAEGFFLETCSRQKGNATIFSGTSNPKVCTCIWNEEFERGRARPPPKSWPAPLASSHFAWRFLSPCLSILVMARPYPSLSLFLSVRSLSLSYSTVGKSGLNGNRKIRFPDPVNGARQLLSFLLSLRFTSVLLASSFASFFPPSPLFLR